MHHYPQNKERTLICLSSVCPDLVSFPGLSQIKPQAPRLVVPLRQFLQVSALRPYSPRNPKTLISLDGQTKPVLMKLSPTPGRHRLMLRLQRYLIIFESPTVVLNQ